MATFTFNMPDVGEGVAEAEIVSWHVAVGDKVSEDQHLVDVMTDKATIDIESPVDGVVSGVAGEVGDVIAVGAMLVEIEVAGESAPAITAAATVTQPLAATGADGASAGAAWAQEVEAGEGAEAPEGAKADPSHPAELAAPFENPGQMQTGQIQTDVFADADAGDTEAGDQEAGDQEAGDRGAVDGDAARNAGPGSKGSEALEPASRAQVLASPAVRARARALGIDLAEVKPASDGRVRHGDLDTFISYNARGGFAPAGSVGKDEAIKVMGLRKRIAANMSASKRHIPHFSYVEEVDVTALEAMRADLNDARGTRPKLTMLAPLITAICKLVPAYPMMNARFDDEAGIVTRHGAVHLGIATQTDKGLMVPVIRDAQSRNLWQLAGEVRRLAEAARKGSATSQELSGSTLTLTSLGPLGGVATTPVINRPEVAIISPNRIIERPMFVADGQGGERIEKRKLMNISISCDHRVVDGHDAASFVQALKKLIEKPAVLLAD